MSLSLTSPVLYRLVTSVVLACGAMLLFAGVAEADDSEPARQTSKVRKSVSGGFNPGLGSGDLESTIVLKLCEKENFSQAALDDAILNGLSEHYVSRIPPPTNNDQKDNDQTAAPTDGNLKPSYFQTQRFILRTDLLRRHNKANRQIALELTNHHSMTLAIEAIADEDRFRLYLTITTELLIGRSNNTASHVSSAAGYDGHFFHQHFSNMIEQQLIKDSCPADS